MNILKCELNKTTYNIVITILYISAFYSILSSGLKLTPDSSNYLEIHVIRSPIYPLFIKLCQIISNSHYKIIVLVFQSTLAIAAIHNFTSFLLKHITNNRYVAIFTICTLFAPYFVTMQIGNMLLSEAIAYPLFLLFLTSFFDAIIEKTISKIIATLIILSLLILTRGQFLFLYFLILIILIILKIINNITLKQLTIAISILITLSFTNNLIEKSYHYVLHGKFITTPLTGIQFATNALFHSTSNDSTIFKDPSEKKIFNKIMFKVDSARTKILTDQPNLLQDNVILYDSLYNVICWKIIFPVLKKELNEKNETILYTKIDKISLSLSNKLLVKNYKQYFRFTIKNFIKGIGYFTMYLSIFLLIYILINLKNKQWNYKHLILLCLIFCHILNLMLVALIEPIITRYTLYTESTFPPLILKHDIYKELLIFIIITAVMIKNIEGNIIPHSTKPKETN